MKTKPPVQREGVAYALLICTVMFWAGNAVIGKAMHDQWPPVALAFWRWLLATLIVLPVGFHHLRRDWSKLGGYWPMVLLMSLLGIACFNTLLYYAAHTTSATHIALMQTVMPAFIVLLGWVLFQTRTGKKALSGVALSMIGAVVVIFHGEFSALVSLSWVAGDMWMLLAVAVYAGYSVLLPKRPPVHPLAFLVLTFGLGTAMLLPLYLVETALVAPPVINTSTLAAVAYVACFPSVLAYFFWNRGVETIGAPRAGVFICLLPLFAAVLGVIFLNETIRFYHLVGALCILAGFFLVHARPD